MGAAIRPLDLAWAKTPDFERRVERALGVVREAAKVGRIGVSFSGGKDSTVTLDLVRRIVPGAPAALFDSGCELSGTLEIASALGVEVIKPRYSMLDMARYSGWWGCANPVDAGCAFDAKLILIQEPSETFVVTRRLRAVAVGMRAEESAARARHASRGELYEGKDRTWRLQPVLRWSLADIWAYIASRELRYHPAYDAMSSAAVPREAQRIAGILGERGAGRGRHVLLREHTPREWACVVEEFPGLR